MQARQFDLANVDAIDLDRALVHVVEARQQVGGRRLPEPEGPDQCHQLAWLGLEVEILQSGMAVAPRQRATARQGACGHLRLRLLLQPRRRPPSPQRRPRRPCRRRLRRPVLLGHRLSPDPPLQDRRPGSRAHPWLCAIGRPGAVSGRIAIRGLRGQRRSWRRSVAEGNLAEPDPTLNGVWLQGHGVRCVGDLDRQVQVLEDPVEQSKRALDFHLDVEQLTEGEERSRDRALWKATMSPMVGADGAPVIA